MELQGYYHLHKNHSVLPILSQMNPAYNIMPYGFKIHLNIIALSMYRSLQLAFPLSFSN
jgi:hypothetical protein